MDLIKEIKSQVDILDRVSEYVKDFKPSGARYVGTCPFHKENNPSFTVYPTDQRFHCFGCWRSGDIFNFLIELKGSPFRDVLNTLAQELRINLDGKIDFKKVEKERLIQDIFMASTEYFKCKLLGTKNVLDYLETRGVSKDSIEKFRIGFAPERYDLLKLLKDIGFSKEDILMSGVIKEGKSGSFYNFFRNRIILPHLKGGRVFYLAGRAFSEAEDPKYIKLSTNDFVRNGLFNADVLYKRNEKVIITEGYFDCILADQSGYPAVSSGGTNLSEEFLDALKGKSYPYQIIFDTEKSGEGRKAALALAETLYEKKIDAELVFLPEDKSKEKVDLADFLLEKRKEALAPLLLKASDFVDYKIHEFSKLPEKDMYRNVENVLVPLLAKLDNLEIEKYLGHINKSLGFKSHKLEALRKAVLKAKREAEISAEEESINSPEPYKMSEEEEKEAKEFLENKDIFEFLEEDLSSIGLVGEKKNAVCLYLISITRKTEEPISAVLSAKSSSGKSYLVKKITELVPPEDCLVITSASAKSLYYYPDEKLDHKLLVIQEIQGMDEIGGTIKIMQSEGRICHLTSFGSPITGKREYQELSKDCRLSVITTTTKDRIHEENSTRIFDIRVDESQEQTIDIVALNKLKTTLDWQLHKDEVEAIKKKHYNVQRLIEPINVVIPFSNEIEFPYSSVRYRRDSARFLNLIKAIALLRQYQKVKKSEGDYTYIEASIDDYEDAYRYGYDMLRRTISELSENEKKLLQIVLDYKRNYEEGHGPMEELHFTRKDIRNWARRQKIELPSDPTIGKVIKSLLTKDIFELEEGGKNKTHLYGIEVDSIAEAKAIISKEILTPRELKKKIEEDEKNSKS